ncbi:MAG TPA: sulfate ABC transporter substrate-binding protein [Candidatus Acidoferrales bacterium]|nr:sulfate ABC transporter substrate-binding protein [Candidatus Acidoferrales bacterium]
MRSLRPILLTVVAFFAMAFGAVHVQAQTASSSVTMLNVSYDPTREFYTAYNALFAAYWKKKTGQTVTINQSHGGSGAQARAVIEGLDADVVTLGASSDIDAIAKSGALPANWQTRLPDESSPYTSTVVFVVRNGNPKHIKDWDDLVKPGVVVITANPKTGAGARWNFLAAYAYALRRNHNDDAKAQAFVGALYKNVPVLDSGARGSTTTFVERGMGDVLIAWENEAYYVLRSSGAGYQIVTPSTSILAQPPVAWVDANDAKHGTQAVAQAYLRYLYSVPAQRLACKFGYRPVDTSVLGTCGTHFAPVNLTSIKEFGGWSVAQPRYFGDGGIFDQLYQPK